jgi:hypothetical protein
LIKKETNRLGLGGNRDPARPHYRLPAARRRPEEGRIEKKANEIEIALGRHRRKLRFGRPFAIVRTVPPAAVRRFALGPRVAPLWMAALLVACGSAPRPADPNGRPSSPLFSQPVPRGREADDAGRFLAGLPGAPGSPFRELEQDAAWATHRAALDREWSRVEQLEIPAIREFATRELAPAGIGLGIVFYPFSGPDALFPRLFFPRSIACVMVGLEPPGTLPAPDRLPRKDLDRYLEQVRATVHSELYRSFFITREMDRQFRGQVSDGLLPTILHLLVRTGHTVEGCRYVRLDEEGRVIDRSAEAPAKGANRGVEIDFRDEADRSAHKLFYFSVNLADARLRNNPAFLKFLAGLDGMTTYLKATSYMPHHEEFSIIRRQVLERSAAILQDDSGIPYRYFDPAVWQLQLYGSYERPYGSFRWLEQADLRKAYQTGAPKPLGFRIGYGFGRIPSNLLLAVRKAARQSPPAPPL